MMNTKKAISNRRAVDAASANYGEAAALSRAGGLERAVVDVAEALEREARSDSSSDRRTLAVAADR